MTNQPLNHESGTDAAETRAALDKLGSHVQTALESNDLGRLAQMHTECQLLAGTAGPLGRLAAALANLLEGIILKEAADPEGGLLLIPQAVEALRQYFESGEGDLEPWETKVATASLGAAPVESAAAELSAQPVPSDSPRDGGEPPHAAPPGRIAETVTPPPKMKESGAAPSAPAQPSAAVMTPPSTPKQAKIEAYVAEPLMLDLNEKDHLQGFIDESREHMDAIEVALLEVEKDPTNSDKINELFRPFHTIKGIAGFLNLRDINRLTHEMETILDMGRRRERAITPATIDLFFSGVDVLKQQIGSLANYLTNPTDGPVPQPDIIAIMARLRAVAAGQEPVDSAPTSRAQAGDVPVAAATNSKVESENATAPAEAGSAKSGVTAGGGESNFSQYAEASIRVDTTKLDFLVDAVGELVIAQTMVNLNKMIGSDEKLARDVAQVTKIVRDVQETAMAMRMVPIGHTFQKMRRLVRDVSRKANKQVDLKISGEETELDKNVIQAIADPLVHMVRNAIDHGIETPEQRRALGKPETGLVHLNAFHQGDSIVIEISDDGRGLDPRKLIAKAIERGMLEPGESLTDAQAYSLIMQAGFSTAEKITDISGRGVGMDVVKRNIDQLRGKIEISSELGRGSLFTIRLPLTLAIIDGMLVRIGQERLIIPTIMIEQTLRPEDRQMTQVLRRGTMIQVRGELITLIQLGSLFGYCPPLDPTNASVVIAQTESEKIGIVVDELIGQQQVVIKTLGERFKQVKGISGAAILGDGRVGLILEPTGLLELHNTSRQAYAYSKDQSVVQVARAAAEDTFTGEGDPAKRLDDDRIGAAVAAASEAATF